MEDTNALYRSIAAQDHSFKAYVWNKQTREFLGRTGTLWFKLLVFYVIFYICLAAFFAVMMVLLYQSIDTQHMPTYIPGDGGSINHSPAMGYRPMPSHDFIQSTLIWYKSGDDEGIKHWVDSLNNFIKAYEATSEVVSGQHITDCSEDKPPKEGEVCRFLDTWLTDKCQKAESWGYKTESPCVLIKFNKMIGWVPEVYERLEELPEEMPQTLKDHIEKRTQENKGKVPKMIWVSCEGENPADQEYLGPIRYSPWQGFPAYYFPYMHTPGYLSPLIAVQFDSPASNLLISIECRAWAKNIQHNQKEHLGLVHFELLKD
ncbi:sodium/potassium-transporting ATPase subunit beta [Procambarus clarkii]|uniref:sodium/potassium-transporting ATPase subunit beta n=1 Tax=Procambarus clarkii TaxID=6728 RepID=UPI001E673442|nr:sodium/potassium-transporting ATPase subunit beta-like [Procambarus clarkii]